MLPIVILLILVIVKSIILWCTKIYSWLSFEKEYSNIRPVEPQRHEVFIILCDGCFSGLNDSIIQNVFISYLLT